MKTRVMQRHLTNTCQPYYDVDTWVHLLGPIGYWKTQMRTIDFDYAASVFNDYKHDRHTKKIPKEIPKDKAILIHYE
jgi:hypothetical protein